MSDDWPIATTYRGVGIHAGQPPKRVAYVKREIDRVSRTNDLLRLYTICGDCSWSPEARILAGAKCIAGLRLATEKRQPKPDIDVADIEASTAGLGSRGWASPSYYGALTDLHYENAVPRETPLEK